MSLSCMSTINSLTYVGKMSDVLFVNQVLTNGTSFGTNITRTDPQYGLITVSASATSTNSTYGISKMLDNNTSRWESLNTDTVANYLNESYTSVSYTEGSEGGEYSDSQSSGNAIGSGLYGGFKNLSNVRTYFTTNYTDDANNPQTALGSYITITFAANYKALIKSFTIGGFTSFNWDDIPRSVIVVGSNDNSTWILIKDASDLGTLSQWSPYLSMTGVNGYFTSTGTSIGYGTYTYPITTTKKFRYLRFVFTRLIRGRVLSLGTFNVTYDIYSATTP